MVTAEIETLPVEAARAGDPAAWDALFRRYQLPLYVYVFELIRDEQASLDIVQESFINAARHVGRLREDAKFGSWLFGIAHQKVIQQWRRQRLEPVPIDEVAERLLIAVAHRDDPRLWLPHLPRGDSLLVRHFRSGFVFRRDSPFLRLRRTTKRAKHGRAIPGRHSTLARGRAGKGEQGQHAGHAGARPEEVGSHEVPRS